jgi:hypothetical protein
VIAVGLGIIWELIGKRAFAREVLESARIAAEVELAGLSAIGTRFSDTPDWEGLFNSATELDIFVAYAATWRHNHADRLKSVLRRGGVIRVYLPTPLRGPTISTMATRFQTDPDELITKITTAKREFNELGDGLKGSIKVLYYPEDMVFTFYRFDNVTVIAFYKHWRGLPSGHLPTLICRANGELDEFIRSELEAIRKASTPADGAVIEPQEEPGVV